MGLGELDVRQCMDLVNHVNVQQFAEVPFPKLDSANPKENGKNCEAKQKTEPEEEKHEDFLIELKQLQKEML